ncbi:MAG: FtsW/RodA/SpoVE family cell cycle protein, partial [Pseudomonadota bacterium]
MNTARPAAFADGASSPNYVPVVPVRRGWREAVRVWWSELDRGLLGLIIILMAVGFTAVLAASPASADQLSTREVTLDPFMFVKRHAVFMCLGLGGMIMVSFLSRDNARRLALIAGLIMFGLLMLVPLIGFERKGAVRWINLGISVQPSEFLKPGFAIALAWILSWLHADPKIDPTHRSFAFKADQRDQHQKAEHD